MQDFLGSVRRSLVFRSSIDGDESGGGGGFGGFVGRINSSIRNSCIGLFAKPTPALPPPPKRDEGPSIRWRKGELIGCGAFGRVYMGMNLDSGELLAVKQQYFQGEDSDEGHIREIEEEVRLLKNLSHPNIVRYLGTVRENDSLNILMEFVPGGSISSLLEKIGSFPEPVTRMYTKQLLLGLEYLHNNGIMHRDIKGANILVDNKGFIRLADFGASKKVVELATINGAKSMKDTPYWMAPEVILQTGHNFSADLWSVGCTVIEMATGKPPWSEQYQQFAAVLHIGRTKNHPPIPGHLSPEAKGFLLKCLHKEPSLRASASELLQHPFVTGEYRESHPASCNSLKECGNSVTTQGMTLRSSINSLIRRSTCSGLKDVCELGSIRSSTVYPENSNNSISYWPPGDSDDLCQMDVGDLCNTASVRFNTMLQSTELNKSFNPMCEYTDNWSCEFDESPEVKRVGSNLPCSQAAELISSVPCDEDTKLTLPGGSSVTEDNDEVTDSKIRAFLDEKALDLKRLQTPLYEEFYNTVNSDAPQGALGGNNGENVLNLVTQSKSPKRLPSRRLSVVSDAIKCPFKSTKRTLNTSRVLQQGTETPQINECFSDRRKKWEEELYEELERHREKLRHAGVGGKTPSSSVQRERSK